MIDFEHCQQLDMIKLNLQSIIGLDYDVKHIYEMQSEIYLKKKLLTKKSRLIYVLLVLE